MPSYFLGVLLCLAEALMAQQAFASITLPQADGTTLILAKPAESIVTLAPNLAELVFAAGAGQQLVAVGQGWFLLLGQVSLLTHKEQ